MVREIEPDSSLTERWVRRLTPPACREEVLGDLAERCVSPREYLHDAMRTLPFVIASRLRRTSHPLQALFIGSFLWWITFYGSLQAHWLTATIPTALILVVLALRDAWRVQTLERQARTVAVDMAAAAAAVLLSQAVLWLVAPTLVLTRPTLLVGLPLGLILLYFLRVQSPTGVSLPNGFTRQLSLGQIRAEIATRDRVIRRAVGIEMCACVIVAAVFAGFVLWRPVPPLGRIGFGLTVLGAAFVAGFLWRHVRVRPIPVDLDFAATVQRYRVELERRRGLSLNYFWWYIVPLGVGLAVSFIGIQRPGSVHRTTVDAAFILAILALPTLLQFAAAAKMRKRIEQLALVSEKREGESS